MKLSRPKSKLSEIEKQKLVESRIRIEKQMAQQLEICEKSNKILASDLLITILPKS